MRNMVKVNSRNWVNPTAFCHVEVLNSEITFWRSDGHPYVVEKDECEDWERFKKAVLRRLEGITDEREANTQ